MTGQNTNGDRDKILLAFHRECERPTAEQISDWVQRFPQYADDIRAHAAVSRDWAAQEYDSAIEPDQLMLARGYSTALNILYDAEVMASHAKLCAAQSFHDIAVARGVEVYQVAIQIDIARGVVADLFNGWMLGPIRFRFVDAVCRILHVGRAEFDSALTFAHAHPRFGQAKAETTPSITPRRYEDIVRDSSMTEDRKRFWLEED